MAYGGTLFLDEIGDLPVHLQTRLLTFLSTGHVRPKGWNGPEPVSVRLRVIAATNRNLKPMIAQGEFREDLYHRFQSRLVVPPLRDLEPDDRGRVILSRFALPQVNPRNAISTISLAAVKKVSSCLLSGNFRELDVVLVEARTRAESLGSREILEEDVRPVPISLTQAEAGFAWCTKSSANRTPEFLLHWNQKWHSFFLAGGSRVATDKDLRATVVRELEKKCGLNLDAQYSFADADPIEVELIQHSGSSGEKKLYRFEIDFIHLNAEGMELVSSSTSFAWVHELDIRQGATHQGRAISSTVQHILLRYGDLLKRMAAS
jgi:hypothetical protein